MNKIRKKILKSENNRLNKFKLLLVLILTLFLLDNFPNIKIYKQNISNNHTPIITKAKINPHIGVIENGNRNKKEIAITLDADMTHDMYYSLQNKYDYAFYNKQIIDYLIKEKVDATIFFTGLWVKAYPKEVKKIAQNTLFEVGNHSFSHPAFTHNCYSLPYIESESNHKEINDAQNEIIKATGIIPKVFRFPGGCFDKEDLQSVSTLNLNAIQWDVVSQDAFNNNEYEVAENVLNNVKNGSIIVMHLNFSHYAPKTYEALIQIIPELKKRGYRFVKITELINKNED